MSLRAEWVCNYWNNQAARAVGGCIYRVAGGSRYEALPGSFVGGLSKQENEIRSSLRVLYFTSSPGLCSSRDLCVFIGISALQSSIQSVPRAQSEKNHDSVEVRATSEPMASYYQVMWYAIDVA